MSRDLMEFPPFMMGMMALSFLGISYCMGMLFHSAFMYEDKGKIKRNSSKGWVLCMIAGTAVTGWMFFYGYYVNFLR